MHHDDTLLDQITTALLLAAGNGCRLRPLTDDQPKCLTEVDGIPILERLVDGLCQQGFTRLVVVVGYLGYRIREYLGERRGSLSFEYVVNPQYDTTNNLYSLWLAREAIQESFLLIESDLLFEPSLLDDLQPANKIAVSSLQPWMNGSTVTVDGSQHVREFQLGEAWDADRLRYKTVNICSLSLWSWWQVIQRLGQHVAAGRVNGFYERVFAEMAPTAVSTSRPSFATPRPGTKSTRSKICGKSSCSSNPTAANKPLLLKRRLDSPCARLGTCLRFHCPRRCRIISQTDDRTWLN